MPLLIAELSRHHLKHSKCFKTKPDCHSLAAVGGWGENAEGGNGSLLLKVRQFKRKLT